MGTKLYKQLVAYCNEHFEATDSEKSWTLDLISESRCSLQTANPNIYNQISDMVTEFQQENALSPDFFDGDIEKLFWDMD